VTVAQGRIGLVSGPTYQDRLRALATQEGYKAPTRVCDHAIDRWIERWRPDLIARFPRHGVRHSIALGEIREMLPRATLEAILVREKSTIWIADGGAKLVVSKDGKVMTVLPPGAVKREYRPRK
jgi:hypothetical protein